MIHNITKLPAFAGLKQRVVWLANELKTLGTWTANQIDGILANLGLMQVSIQQAEIDIINLQSQAGIFSYQVDLSKTDINNLHATPITITNTMLGLGVGDIPMYIGFVIEKYRDGVDFASATGYFKITDLFADTDELMDNTITKASTDKTYVIRRFTYDNPVDITGNITTVFTISNPSAAITGGGANCYVRVKIYYVVMNKTFLI